jgi:protein-tyrosine-phosphatase
MRSSNGGATPTTPRDATVKGCPRTLAALVADEEEPFDLIVSLSPEAHHRLLDLVPQLGKAAEYWPTFDPSLAEGSREQRLMEFRMVRDGLDRRIAARFPRPSTG